MASYYGGFRHHRGFAMSASRSRPRTFWRDLIAGGPEPSQTVADYCRRHGVSTASFFAWRKRLRDEPAAPPAPGPAFVPIRVVPDVSAEIALPAGLTVRVPVHADPAAVARLVAALAGVSPC